MPTAAQLEAQLLRDVTAHKFNADGYKHRTKQYDDLMAAKAEYRGNLNFSAYRQGSDPQYLGVIGLGNYYAKPWGNDSSNVQSVLNGPAYWKRVYYRQNIAAQFHADDKEAERKHDEEMARKTPPIRKAVSAPMLRLSDEPPADSYANIKETMRPLAERHGKPRIRAMQTGERLTFFNTLGNKYNMKAGGKNLEWNVSKETHRSTPTEMRWILSNYFRTDTHAVLKGLGSSAPQAGDECTGAESPAARCLI